MTKPVKTIRANRGSGLSALSIHRPVATLVLTSVVIVMGMLFFDRLPVSLLPDVSYPHLRVVVNYPGVTPEVIEEQVTRVLERNLSATENLAEIHGRASEGRSYIEMYFEVGTDIDLALQDAARQLERARANLPAGIDPPRLMKMDPSQNPVFELAFSSPLRSSVELREWIDQRLVPQLLTVRGSGTIEVAGGRQREIEVLVDPEKLRSYGLNLDDINRILALRNVDIASGNLSSEEYDVLARTESRYRDAVDVASTLIRLPGSSHTIRLSDVAQVQDAHREQRLFARYQGNDAVQLTIMKQPDANTVDVIEGIQETLERLSSTGFIPSDIQYESIRDDSFFIRASLRSVSLAAIMGGLLSVGVILLFLGSWRKSLIVGLSLPVAIIGTFLLMLASGISLNVMSLGGLALGVGLLIDNGLVMLENIVRHQQKLGKDAMTASLEGAAEVSPAIVAGTLTNLAAVMPFLLLSGMAALIFRELILTIAFAMGVSLIAALSLVPALTAMLRKSQGRKEHAPSASRNRFIEVFGKSIDRLSEAYSRLIAVLIARRYLVGIISVMFLVLAVWQLGRTGSEFLPPVDDGRITMRYVLPLGTPPEQTRDAAMLIEEMIAGMPHVKHFYSTSGGYFRGGQLSLRGGMIDMVVQLIPPSRRRGYSAETWVADFNKTIRESGLVFTQQRIRGPRLEGLRTSFVDDDISVGILGEDLDILESLAREVVDRLRGLSALSGVRMANEERIPQVLIRFNEERATQMGIQIGEAGQSIRTAVDGFVPTRYVSGGFEYNIRVRLPRSITASSSEMASMPVYNPNGQSFPLGSVADFIPYNGPAHIERLNQIRIVRVNATANLEELSVGQAAERVRQELSDMSLPEGYAFVFGGAAETITEASRSMRLAILLAIFFVFVVLAVQYERFSAPLIILSGVPFSVIGLGAIIWLSGIPLSSPVLLGVIFLVGILVNNAILLLDFAYREQHINGLSPAEAVARAGAARLRPVIMTSLTTILGMLPLALSLGEGGELLQPLALSVIGGLLAGTLLTLILLPGIFVMAEDIRHFFVGLRAKAS